MQVCLFLINAIVKFQNVIKYVTGILVQSLLPRPLNITNYIIIQSLAKTISHKFVLKLYFYVYYSMYICSKYQSIPVGDTFLVELLDARVSDALRCNMLIMLLLVGRYDTIKPQSSQCYDHSLFDFFIMVIAYSFHQTMI